MSILDNKLKNFVITFDLGIAIAAIASILPVIGACEKVVKASRESTENWVRLHIRLDRIEEEVAEIKSRLHGN